MVPMTNSLAPSAIVTTRDHPKSAKFLSIVAQAYNKAGLSEEEAQNVNETGGLSDLVGRFIAKNRTKVTFKNECVPSDYGYGSGYTGPKPIYAQVKAIREAFPDAGFGYFIPDHKEIVAPVEAEGLFAIPRWQVLGTTYGEAVQKVLAALKGSENKNWSRVYIDDRERPSDSETPRQSRKSIQFWKKIEQQGHNILLVPAQFGLRHRGRSVRCANELMGASECGLGAFAIGIMLLTHPERLQDPKGLQIFCAGDESYGSYYCRFDHVPRFSVHESKLEYSANFGFCPYAHESVVSGFLPRRDKAKS
jgi:hypothetical protein